MKIKTYYCQMVTNRLGTMVPNLERAFPYFDHFLVVDGGSTDGTIAWLEQQPKVELINFKWCDSFPRSRNQYFKKVASIREPDEISVCCVADDDEFYSEALMHNINIIAQQIIENQSNQLAIRCRSVTLDKDLNRIAETVDEFWKPLIFIWEPGILYEDSENTAHETLLMPSGQRQIKANDFAGTDQEIMYEHIKREGVVWQHGLRNFYTCGSGHHLKDNQPLWRPFLELLSRHGTFESWTDVEEYLSKGNIAPEIKEWFIKHRKHGLPSCDPQFTEIREGFLAYFIWYHPEELPKELLNQDKDYMDYSRAIKRIHGQELWSKII